MLTPEYLDALPDEAAALWRTVEDDILRDVARRIGKAGEFTAAADHQAWRLEQVQALRGDVVKTLARYSGRSDAVMRRLLQQAGRDALAADDAVYRAAGLVPGPINDNAALLNLLNAGYRQTRGTWKNLTATTARTVTRQFEAALDRACLQVSSGAFDHEAAIKRAVDGLARDMKYITYPGGRRDTLETAVRRAVLTGVNQTASKLQLARAEEMGCEFAEVSAHAGARPSHAEWQGKVYHIGGAVTVDGVRYEGFEAATHYGAGDGLCGWNCRHSFHPFFPGVSERAYSDEELAKLEDGEEYQRRQQQRELEREVRAAKRQYLAESEAGLDAAGAKAQWQRAERELAEVLSPTYESRQKFREEVYIIGPMKGDAVTHRSIYNDLNRSEVGKKTLDLILSGDYDIEISYTTDVRPGLLGETKGKHILIYGSNTQSVRRTSETLIHEITHASESIGGDQWAEARCISAEWLHQKGKLTFSDLRAIVKMVKNLYPEYKWRIK